MPKSTTAYVACPNPLCRCFGEHCRGNIRRHSFYTTSRGRRRRFICTLCKKTFSSTASTPYYRLKKSRRCFDIVAEMSIEGISKSVIARIQRLAWNTVARWLDLAARFARRFNERMVRGFALIELQADELCTLIGNRRNRLWLFTTLEVWSRLWVSVVAGERCYASALAVWSATLTRGRQLKRFFFTTDGFDPYGWAVKKLISGLCVYGQVIKYRRNGHVVRVERRLVSGTKTDLRQALFGIGGFHDN